MSKFVSLDQVTQLREIERARVRARGVGYAAEFQAFLDQLKSGGVSPGTTVDGGTRRKRNGSRTPDRDPRVLQQAKVLWDKGWARVMAEAGIAAYNRFEDYAASLPPIPEFPVTWVGRFPHLVLIDKRPFLRPELPLALTTACALLGVKFERGDSILVPHDPKTIPLTLVYWMRCQDGKAYRNRKLKDCRAEFVAKGDEVVASAFEGLSLFAQHPDLLEVETAWDLPGSVHASDRDGYAYLKRCADGGVKLSWDWLGDAHPNYGSLSRGSVALNSRL